MDAVRETLDSIYDVDIIVAESEMEGCQSLLSMYDKIEMITENYNGDSENLGDFSIIQEGERFDAWKKDVKKQNEGKSTLNKIIFTIPRMIMSLFRLITGKLKKIDGNTSARIDKQLQTNEAYSSAVGTFIQGIKQPQTKGGTIARNVVGILLAGAAIAGTAFGGKKLFDHIKKETNDFKGKSPDEKMKNLLKIDKGDSDKVKHLKTKYLALWEKVKEYNEKYKGSELEGTYLQILNDIDTTASKDLRDISNGADKKDIKECEKLKEKVITICIDSVTDAIFGKLLPDKFINNKTVRDTICKILKLEDRSDENIKNTLKEEGMDTNEELVKTIQDGINKVQEQAKIIEDNAKNIGLEPHVVLNNIIETDVDGLIPKGKKLLVPKLRTCFDINEITKKIATAGAALVTGVTDTGDKANGIWRQQFADKPAEFNGVFEITKGESRTLVSIKDAKELEKLKKSFEKALPLIFIPKKPSDAIELKNLASGATEFDFNKGIPDTIDLDDNVKKFVNYIINYINKCDNIMTAIVNYILCVYNVAENMYYVTTDGKMYVKSEKGKKKSEAHQKKLDKKAEKAAENEKKKAEEAAKKKKEDTGESGDKS
jgi:hypothetical protein